MLRILRIFGGVVSVSLQRELAFRADFAVRVGLTIVTAAGTLGTLAAVFARVRTLAGWSFGDAVVLVGMFVVVNGLLQAFVEPNLEWFQGKVRAGLIDDLLLKPAPSAFLASFGTCRPFALVDVVIGAGLAAGGLLSSRAIVTPSGLGACALLLAAGTAIAWSMRLVLAAAAFWAGGLELTVLFFAPWQLGRYPVDVYGRGLRLVLTYVVPVAFVSTLPARALTHGAAPSMLAGGVAAAGASSFVALAVWRAGLRRYTSATS